MIHYNSDVCYLAPEVEIIEVAVEFGFSSSIEDPIEEPEQDW